MAEPTAEILAFPEPKISIVNAYLRGLPSDATRSVYEEVVGQFEKFLGGRLLDATRRDVEAYRSHLESLGRARATIARNMSALSGFFEFAVEEGRIDRNPVSRARRPKVPDCSPRRALSADDVRRLLAACDTSSLGGLRDRTLIVCLAVQGWRVAEALALKVEDLGEEAGHHVATICGKGGKVARVPLAAQTWTALLAWTNAAGVTSGAVFVGVTKGGKARFGKALSQQAVWERLQLVSGRAGLKRRLHAHLFRHTAVTNALAANVPLHQVQDFARHADPRTTRRYDSHRASLANPTPHVLGSLVMTDE